MVVVQYGAVPHRPGSHMMPQPKIARTVAAGITTLVVGALVGLVVLSVHVPTELESPNMQLATMYNGDSVAVPSTSVDYSRGTNFSPQSPFENSAMDKSARVQQLSDGGAHDDREQVNYDEAHETKYLGGIPVDETLDAPLGLARPRGYVGHLDCSGRDDDPECQTSVSPLFDKSKGVQSLSAKKAANDLDKYFAAQQKRAAEARKPSKNSARLYGSASEKLTDSKGTKFGLSGAAARAQMKSIFTAPTRKNAVNAQMKVAGGQQLSTKTTAHHGFSTKVADEDLQKWYTTMPAANNHALAKRSGKEQHGARKASSTQMLRSNRDDAFVGDASAVTKPGMPVKFGSSSAARDLGSYFSGLKRTGYGANNGHLKDTIPQPNLAKGQHHGKSSASAIHDIDSYFANMGSRSAARAGVTTDSPKHGARRVSGKAAALDISAYFAGMAPHVKHAQAKVDLKLDSRSAQSDLNGFWSSLAAGQHGSNNGHLHAKNSHAQPKQEALAAVPEQPNMEPKHEMVGDVEADVHVDTPLWQGYNSAQGYGHPDANRIDDKDVDASKADCGENQDCTSSRSPLMYKGDHKQGSLRAMDTDAKMSAEGAQADIAKYFSKEESAMKVESQVEEQAAAKVGLTDKAARKAASQFFNTQGLKLARKAQKLSEYGVGPEEDHQIVVNQAMGVDAMMPESMFDANPKPSDDTLAEVNDAVQAQRNEGYTNGDGAPAADIEAP